MDDYSIEGMHFTWTIIYIFMHMSKPNITLVHLAQVRH
jgi:hypothetical protein